MANQMQERQSDKHQPRERFAWILWIIIGIVLIAILAFAIAAILILENQGIMQGSTTLNLIYIVVATGISLLGLLFTFLQWFYPRHTSEHDTSILSSHLSRQRTIVGQAHPSQDLPLLPQPAQMIPHTILKVSQETGTGNDLLLEQSIKHRPTIEPRFPSLHREDWGEAPYISQFYGRERELVELKRWIEDDHCRMIAIWGRGCNGSVLAKVVNSPGNRN